MDAAHRDETRFTTLYANVRRSVCGRMPRPWLGGRLVTIAIAMCSSIQCRLRHGVGMARRGRGVGRWWGALGAMLVTLGWAPCARAEATFAFSWRAEPGASCLTEEKVRKAVEKKLGRTVFSSVDEADIAIDGEELADHHPYRVRVKQHDRAGRELGARELTAETCDALERMTVVFIVLVLEPDGPGSRLPNETPPATTADEVTPPPEAVSPIAPNDPAVIAASPGKRRPRVMPHAPPHRVELHAGVGVGASVGLLPSLSASVRLMTRLTMQGSRLSADWSLGLSPPQNVTGGVVQASFAAVDQRIRGCWAWFDRPSSRIDTCAGALFGALVPTGANLDERSGAAISLLGPEASLGLRLSDGPATLHIELGVAALPRPQTISYLTRDGENRALYSTPPVMAMGVLAGTFRAF